MHTFGEYKEKVDYFFWGILLFFSNPGGIHEALSGESGGGGIDMTDIAFILLLGCFALVHRRSFIRQDPNIMKFFKYCVIFLIYYLLVFSFFTPKFTNNPMYSLPVTMIKIRFGIMNIMLIFIVYEFYLRSYKIFYRWFLYSSIVIVILFVITVFTGLDILPIKELDRKFIAIKRMIMEDYGLMFILIPMGVVSMVYKFKIKNNKLIILGFLAVFLAFLLALTRRYIFGTLIYFALAAVLFNYMYHKPLIPIKKTLAAMFYLGIFFVALGLAFPQYTEAGIVAGEETWNVIVRGETSTGLKDSRLGLGKTFIQDKIVESPLFGTGFDNRWRTKEGDTMGYEASDYPFLGAIAMYGIVGLLFFLPIYIVLLKRMYFDLKQLRARYIDLNSFEAYALIVFLLYFIYDFLLYMNWFLPISVIKDSKWYIFVGMYFACRRAFYNTVDTDPAIQGQS